MLLCNQFHILALLLQTVSFVPTRSLLTRQLYEWLAENGDQLPSEARQALTMATNAEDTNLAIAILKLFGFGTNTKHITAIEVTLRPPITTTLATATATSSNKTPRSGVRIALRDVCPFGADPLLLSDEYAYCKPSLSGECPVGFLCDHSFVLQRSICCQDLRSRPNTVTNTEITVPDTVTTPTHRSIQISSTTRSLVRETTTKAQISPLEPSSSSEIPQVTTTRRLPWYIRDRSPSNPAARSTAVPHTDPFSTSLSTTSDTSSASSTTSYETGSSSTTTVSSLVSPNIKISSSATLMSSSKSSSKPIVRVSSPQPQPTTKEPVTRPTFTDKPPTTTSKGAGADSRTSPLGESTSPVSASTRAPPQTLRTVVASTTTTQRPLLNRWAQIWTTRSAPQNTVNVSVLLPGFIRTMDGVQHSSAATVALINDNGRLILVDTGAASDTERLLQNLAKESIKVDEIDAIVITHPHPEHMANLNFFAQKPILFHLREYIGHHFHPTELRDRPYRKLSSNVEVWKTPGHTQQSLSVLVLNVAGYGTMAIVGDLIPSEAFFTEKTDVVLDEGVWDSTIKRQNANLMICMADWIIPGHGAPFHVLPRYRQNAGCTRLMARQRLLNAQ